MTRIAVLGTGGMAEYQVKKFNAMDGVRVVACVDADGAKAEQFGLAHGIPDRFSDLDTLLNEIELDGVSCCLVDSLHYRNCIQVLKHGLPFFCEKPLAQSLAQAEEMTRLAAHKLAMVNLSKRNAPALHALKDGLDKGLLGRIESVDARYHQGWVLNNVWGDWAATPRWRWRLQPEYCTAGVAGDLGVHLMDALIFLFGEPAGIRAERRTDLDSLMSKGMVRKVDLRGVPASGDSDVNGFRFHPAYVELVATMSFGAGIPCRFSTSWIDESALDSFRIHIKGSEAEALLDLEFSRSAYKINYYRDGEGLVEGPGISPTYASFVEAVRTGTRRTPDFSDALAAQRWLEPVIADTEKL